MNTLKYTTILLIIFPFFSNMLMAQQNQTQISGYVYNSDREPALYSTIMLLNKDSVLIKGTFSEEDGLFLLENISPGEYFIQVRNLEFKTYFSDLISVKQDEKYMIDWIILSHRL